MTDVLFQPQGNNTTRKEGTAIIGRPKGETGVISGADYDNYSLDNDVINLPTTGTQRALLQNRLDDYGFWTGGTGVPA